MQDEVKKLHDKQEELNKRERVILTIKDNTTNILQLLLQRQQGGTTISERKKQEPTISERKKEAQKSTERKKQEPTSIEGKIHSLNKTKELKHNSYVWSIT